MPETFSPVRNRIRLSDTSVSTFNWITNQLITSVHREKQINFGDRLMNVNRPVFIFAQFFKNHSKIVGSFLAKLIVAQLVINSRLVWNHGVHCRINKNQPLDPILS